MFFQTLSTKGKYIQIHHIHKHSNIYTSQKRGLKNITQNTATMEDDLHAVKTYARRYCKNSDSLLFTIYSSIIWYMTVHSVKWYFTKWDWKGSIPRKKSDIFICHHISTAVELTYHSIWETSTALSLEDGAGTWSWSLQPFTYVVKTIKSFVQHLLYTGILKSLFISPYH